MNNEAAAQLLAVLEKTISAGKTSNFVHLKTLGAIFKTKFFFQIKMNWRQRNNFSNTPHKLIW